MFKRQICHPEVTVLLQCTIIVRKFHRHPERTLGDCAKVAFSRLILAFPMGSRTVSLCVRLTFVNFPLRPHRQKCNASDKKVRRTVRASSNSCISVAGQNQAHVPMNCCSSQWPIQSPHRILNIDVRKWEEQQVNIQFASCQWPHSEMLLWPHDPSL